MSRPLISTFVLSLLLGACGADLDHAQLGRRRVAVAFGEPDTGHRSVGVVGNGCTGTLIGRRTVLTAGHCIPDSGAAPAFTVTTDGNERYEGASAVLHPQIDLGAQNFSDFDIAIVRLQRPVSGVVPTQLSFDPPLPGTTVTLVGYGIPGDSGLPGFKRTGQARLSQVDTYVFLHSREPARPTICSGDSGGPVLVDGAGGERVIGVNSAGTVPCDAGFGYGVHVRVDAHRAFIEKEAGADLYTGGAIDIDAPEVTITSPAAGARPEPSFTLEADAVDAASGITRVELWIEGTRQGELSAAPYRFEVSGLERRLRGLYDSLPA